VIDAFAGTDAFENLRKFVGRVPRDQDVDRPPDDFCSGIAVDPLRPPVPAQDRSVEILAMMASSDDSTMAARRLAAWSSGWKRGSFISLRNALFERSA